MRVQLSFARRTTKKKTRNLNTMNVRRAAKRFQLEITHCQYIYIYTAVRLIFYLLCFLLFPDDS